MAPERIDAINLTNNPEALAWLSEPTLCLHCEGDGKVVDSGWDDTSGAYWATISKCPGCLGTGYAVWFSWN